MNKNTTKPGWQVKRSIAIELDVAVFYVRLGPDALPKGLSGLAMSIPDSWFEEFDRMTTTTAGAGLLSIVEPIARWAGVLSEDSYDTASAAMREITVQDAIDQITTSSGLEPDPELDGVTRLLDLDYRLQRQLLSPFGFDGKGDASDDPALIVAASALRGETLHGRFWHWMDRFYYEAYGPWRTTRKDVMEASDRLAIDHLGSLAGEGPPDLSWLPEGNPLIKKPEVGAAVAGGDVDLILWTEPFGLSDTWAVAPGIVITAFAEEGHLYEHYHRVRETLAKRIKAVGDPTRLSILRMIRMHDLDNTQIASCLGLSRPTVSVHAKALADAGLISTTREGRKAIHSCEPDAIRRLFDDLATFLDVPDWPPNS